MEKIINSQLSNMLYQDHIREIKKEIVVFKQHSIMYPRRKREKSDAPKLRSNEFDSLFNGISHTR
jgi:hypothetical protein